MGSIHARGNQDMLKHASIYQQKLQLNINNSSSNSSSADISHSSPTQQQTQPAVKMSVTQPDQSTNNNNIINSEMMLSPASNISFSAYHAPKLRPASPPYKAANNASSSSSPLTSTEKGPISSPTGKMNDSKGNVAMAQGGVNIRGVMYYGDNEIAQPGDEQASGDGPTRKVKNTQSKDKPKHHKESKKSSQAFSSSSSSPALGSSATNESRSKSKHSDANQSSSSSSSSASLLQQAYGSINTTSTSTSTSSSSTPLQLPRIPSRESVSSSRGSSRGGLSGR
jgi:hypothetical protein